ncbi:hypothetical protein M409DRAFT_65887 [Zasmidium cellare ATCC 36951]|uniref:Purine-cytosine permease n=1 Tax=Zasmidium cellare ATCC 36951 TaxID=1080233 RepID=A0A6A6CPU1_ZASCE|nr:uncharacterized protein M409DRAFT_65887 [Zasmidium cellare ATCC 36951]KAF2167789.1 hypothetical protein M409DRAFT_65887 [Zasmidium cellare ATCC 36951]
MEHRSSGKTVSNVKDEEHGIDVGDIDISNSIDRHGSMTTKRLQRFWQKLTVRAAIEVNGIQPVPIEERNEHRVFNVFTVWFTLSTNLLPIVTGMVGTLSYGLSLRDAALVILFFCILCCVPTAYLATLGPKTGMRQMVQARFSFGYYLVSIPVILNLATLTGFVVIDSVIGGLTLSSVTSVAFCGFKVLHQYERYAWIPALIALVVATGCGGTHLRDQAPTQPATAQTILSFGGLVAGFLIPWAVLASDFATYMPPNTPSIKIFAYTYSGLFLPTVLLMTLGAAIGGAVPQYPSWQAGYDATSAGGILAAMLEPAGGFGKFLVVLLSLSILGNISATMYSISLNFQLLVPWLVRTPRAVFCVVVTAIAIPVSIRAAVSFFNSLENFIGIIGYWSAAFVAVVTCEHIIFRGSDSRNYDHLAWNESSLLPSGVPAILAAVLSFGLVIPCMNQVWYTGPIAVHTGDIGFEMALVVTAVLYVPLRHVEVKMKGKA